MIVIDGRESGITLSNYANLEEILVKMTEDGTFEQRIVTDVLVNDATFSELYPHQAEDISTGTINRLEVRTVSVEEMAADIVQELPKVIDILAAGSREVAALLRRSQTMDAMEVMQDTINVSREFLNTIHTLRHLYGQGGKPDLDQLGDTLGGLLGEVGEALGNQDWILVADLMEYEYIPACEGWRSVIRKLA